MNISDDQKYNFFELMKRDAKYKIYHNEYMKEYRRKRREQGIHEPSVISKSSTQNVYNFLYKQNAILCIEYLFK